jgi:hypothetical protein
MHSLLRQSSLRQSIEARSSPPPLSSTFSPNRKRYVSSSIYYSTTPDINTTRLLPSSECIVHNTLKSLGHSKWGWVIYRCTYNDDEAWDRFKQLIDQYSREAIAKSDTPEVAESLEWTFVEDRHSLDGVSRDQLRARFKAWKAKAFAVEQPRVKDQLNPDFGIPRYTYFIQVDEEALRSVIDEVSEPNPTPWYDCEGHVNLVYADWKPMSEWRSECGVETGAEDDDEEHEPIDGCCEEDVGWMKITAQMVDVEFYEAMGGPPDIWYVFYQRLPQVVDY